MKNFKNYTPDKYNTEDFKEVEEGVYLTKDPYGYHDQIYVTSLSFEHEPERYCEEDGSPRNITQIPFENILDEFSLFVTDFYDDLNKNSDVICYQEFGASNLENIKNLREIIGKHVYVVPCTDEEDILEDEDCEEEEFLELVIE